MMYRNLFLTKCKNKIYILNINYDSCFNTSLKMKNNFLLNNKY